MDIAEVVGNVWATRKEETLNGLKLLIVQPVDWHGGPCGHTIVAADRLGAGLGELVLVTRGSSARQGLARRDLPVDAVVVGIIDRVEVEKVRPHDRTGEAEIRG